MLYYYHCSQNQYLCTKFIFVSPPNQLKNGSINFTTKIDYNYNVCIWRVGMDNHENADIQFIFCHFSRTGHKMHKGHFYGMDELQCRLQKDTAADIWKQWNRNMKGIFTTVSYTLSKITGGRQLTSGHL